MKRKRSEEERKAEREGRLQQGNAVQLRGGGPKMRVEEVVDNEVRCSWKVGEEKHEKRFRRAQLDVISWDLAGD